MSGPRPVQPLALAARHALWDQLWARLLAPLPSDVVPADDPSPTPEEQAEHGRTKERPR